MNKEIRCDCGNVMCRLFLPCPKCGATPGKEISGTLGTLIEQVKERADMDKEPTESVIAYVVAELYRGNINVQWDFLKAFF